ncbi:MAG: ABC transporter substrate-binding protein [Pseudomonadota bacterium]
MFKLVVPDLISNSYFPAIAAIDLGFFKEEGLDVELELLFPVNKSYEALRDGSVAFVAGSAHSALAAFPNWDGVKLVCAQGQGMYWYLVMDKAHNPRRLDLDCVKGKKIGAAPWVEMGLRRMLIAAGYDLERDDITIMPVPGAAGGQPSVNFGLMAADALQAGKIDGFWANGVGTQVALNSGVGDIIVDVRRREGPAEAFNFTMASIATSDAVLADNPGLAEATVRAMNKTHAALKEDPKRAQDVANKRFPAEQAALIVPLIERDLPAYSTGISENFVAGMNQFCSDLGLLTSPVAYTDVVAEAAIPLWT